MNASSGASPARDASAVQAAMGVGAISVATAPADAASAPAPETAAIPPAAVSMDAGAPSLQVDAASAPAAEGAATPPASPATPRASARDAGARADAAASEPAPVARPGPIEGGGAQRCELPAAAQLEDVSAPTTIVGSGTAASCTSAAFVAAVAKGGVITFDCGPEPVTITLEETAKVFNDRADKVIIDGGGKVTLSGGGKRRILYQNTCDARQVLTTARCDDQPYPELVVQNLTLVAGHGEQEGGGAIYAQGGRLAIRNSRFYDNVCALAGTDVGGGAVRALQQHQGAPVYVVDSTFGSEEGRGNRCSNGGALSSTAASLVILNSTFHANQALGVGASPAREGTGGGGNGGAVYADGHTFDVRVCGSTLARNRANEGGGGLFFVSNDRTGTLRIERSTLERNPSGTFESHPGIFALAKGEPGFVDAIVR